MFGIFADIVKETVKTAKCIDDTVTDVYKDVKEASEEMGIGPESQRKFIRDISNR